MTRPSNFAVLLDSGSDEESTEEEKEVAVKESFARSAPKYKPGDFVCITSEEDAFTYKVIKVGDNQFEGQLRIARIDADSRDKSVGLWTTAESLVKMEASDPRVAELGTKKGKRVKAKELKQASIDDDETILLAAIEAAAAAGEEKDAAVAAKAAPTAVQQGRPRRGKKTRK